MARLQFHCHKALTTLAETQTLLQVQAPAQQRLIIHSVEMELFGSTGASAQYKFALILQTDAGGSAALPGANVQKKAPAAAETVQSTFRERLAGAEPTGTQVHGSFAVHQQTSRTWIPPDGPIIVEGAVRMGVVYQGADAIPLRYKVNLEE